MKALTAITVELDDKEKALADIMSQIKAGGELCKYTVGLILCHYEFVLSGTAAYISEKLPFTVIGATTTLTATNESISGAENFRLSIGVFTSDTDDFKVLITDPLTVESDPKAVCEKLFAKGFTPKLNVMLVPNIRVTDLDSLLDAAVAATGGAPVFGGCSVDDSATYTEHCYVIKDGNIYEDRVIFIAIDGGINPHFITTVAARKSWIADTAIVTKSCGNEIIEVNNRPVMEYIDRFGLPINLTEEGVINSAVFIVNDGTGTYGRSIKGLTDKGTLLLFGRVPEGSQITVSTFDKKAIFDASINATREIIAKHPDATFALVSSCESRHVVLGANVLDGEDMLQREFAGRQFIFAYAGGEICPISSGKSEVLNHSYCICLI
jgi:hypothetical protein